jgi:hypothetical protein
MKKPVKISFNIESELIGYIKECALKEKISTTELISKLLSNGIFINESIKCGNKVFKGKDSKNLNEIIFK